MAKSKKCAEIYEVTSADKSFTLLLKIDSFESGATTMKRVTMSDRSDMTPKQYCFHGSKPEVVSNFVECMVEVSNLLKKK